MVPLPLGKGGLFTAGVPQEYFFATLRAQPPPYNEMVISAVNTSSEEVFHLTVGADIIRPQKIPL